MRTNPSLLVKLIGIGVLFIAVPARADYEQWQYWAQWDTSTKFSAKEDAEEHMRAGPNWKDAYLTVPVGIDYMTKDYYRRKWTTEPIDPIIGDWEYSGCGGSGPSYEQVRDACLAYMAAATPGDCGELWAFVGDLEWTNILYTLGHERDKQRQFQYNAYGYSSGQPPQIPPFCFWESNNPQATTIYAERYVQCPSGWSADYNINKCVLPHVSWTYGKPVMCGPEVGNPCDAANGAKIVRAVRTS